MWWRPSGYGPALPPPEVEMSPYLRPDMISSTTVLARAPLDIGLDLYLGEVAAFASSLPRGPPALSSLRRMKAQRVHPDAVAYNTLIRVADNARR